MRILNINKFHYLRGGTERYYFSLTKLLEDDGIDVIPFSMQDSRNLPSQFSKYFVPNLELGKPGLKMLKDIPRFIWSKQAQYHLEALIEEYQPELAHIHNIYHQMSPAILPILKKHKIPVVMTVHDYKLICPNYSLFTEGAPCTRCKGHKYYNAVLHKCLKNSVAVSALAATEMSIHKLMQVYEKNIAYFIAPSEFVKKQLVEFGQDEQKITVLPHFIDPKFLQTPAPVASPSVPPKTEPYLLYFGRLSTEKGIDKLLEFMYIYRPILPLKIAGSGPLLPWIKDYIELKGLHDQVELLGQLSTPDLIKTIQGASVVIIPSRVWETFGFSALEAIALGTPVVAYKSGALPEIITPLVGRVVDFDNGHSLMSAVEEVSRWDKAEVKVHAQALINSKYLPQQHLQKLKSIYQQACANYSSNLTQ